MADEILRSLGRIEGQLDGIENHIATHFDRMNRIDKQIQEETAILHAEYKLLEERTRHLERRQYGIYAVAAAVSALIGLIFNFLGVFKS